MIFPPHLQKGDKVAIVSPASAVNPDYVDGAVRMLSLWGYVPVIGTHCKGRNGYYSGTPDERLGDLREALLNPEIKAILCSRGGYGCVHLIEHITLDEIKNNPKWLIGFSDVSALHALFNKAGVASIHASMAKHLALHDSNDYCNAALYNILQGRYPTYEIEPHDFNRCGEVKGTIVGGNLAVLGGLVGTNIDLLQGDKILFIEDIAEPIYKVERLLYNLRLSGVLQRLNGLIVGRFTQYDEPNANSETMYGMIKEMVAPYGFPVSYNFPIGHIDENLPVVEGSRVELSVTPQGVRLSIID